MYRRILLVLSAVTFLLGVNRLSFAQAHTEHEHGVTEAGKAAVSEEAVNVGNKICPVSGEKIEEKTKATYEYEGKVYNFCCAACIEEFKNNPQKYIKKVEQELQGKPQDELKSEEGAMHQGHHH